MEEFDALRERMVVEQIVGRGVTDPKILQAMREVPRHFFIPEEQRERAYEDRALPIGYHQTISQPYMVALMLKALDLSGQEHVLEIGTGGGYQAALLGRLAKEVETVEIVPGLAERARTLLEFLGLSNVHVHARDGSGGLPERAPFDTIIMAAAAPDVPPPLLDQLAPGGRLLLPLERGDRDMLTLIQKHGDGFDRRDLSECAFVPLTGAYGVREG